MTQALKITKLGNVKVGDNFLITINGKTMRFFVVAFTPASYKNRVLAVTANGLEHLFPLATVEAMDLSDSPCAERVM